MKKKGAGAVAQADIVIRCGLYSLSESFMQSKLWSVFLYPQSDLGRVTVIGRVITSRTILMLNDIVTDILIIARVYEVGSKRYFKSKGYPTSLKEYCKTRRDCFTLKTSATHLVDLWQYFKPLSIGNTLSIRLIDKASPLITRNKGLPVIPKIIIECVRVPKQSIADPYFFSRAIRDRSIERLPLYYLSLPFYSNEYEYDKWNSSNVRIQDSLVALHKLTNNFTPPPRATQRSVLGILSVIGNLSHQWLLSKAADLNALNDIAERLFKNKDNALWAGLLFTMFQSLISEMMAHGKFHKCANPKCSQYFPNKHDKRYCKPQCVKKAKYLRDRKDTDKVAVTRKRNRAYMKEYRKL